MKDLNLYKNIDEFITGESKSELIRRVFENKTKAMLSKNKIQKMNDGGSANGQEVYTPYEFLHELLPKVYGRKYVVTDEEGQKMTETIEAEEKALNEFVLNKISENKVSRIYDLDDKALVTEIETKRRALDSKRAFITESELQAYLFCHPEINHEMYVKEVNFDKEFFLQQGLIMMDFDVEENALKYVYRYEYLSGNLYKKGSKLNLYKSVMQNQSGMDLDSFNSQIDYQLDELEKFKPIKAKITMDDYNRIHIHPKSEFSENVFRISENDWEGDVKGNGTQSLKDAFRWWATYEMDKALIKRSRGVSAILSYYVELQKGGDDRTFVNTRIRAFEDGELMFKVFLSTALNSSCKSRLELMWNELYNNYTEQLFYKIPVALTLSKKFKVNSDFKPNETQIQSVQYIKNIGSGLLAYGVGVGKTASSILNVSYAFDHNLAKKALFVVPKPTYAKWIKEIEGGEEITYQVVYKEEGDELVANFSEKREAVKFSKSVKGVVREKAVNILGLLPHLPPIVGLDNLNVGIVKSIKDYTEQELNQMNLIDELIEFLKEIVPTYSFNDSIINQKIKSMFDDFELENLTSDYKEYQDKLRKNQKLQWYETPKGDTMLQFFTKIVQKYKNELPFILGKLKEFPEKTIFVCTYKALNKLGLNPSSPSDLSDNDSIFGKLFTELTQGEQVENFVRKGKIPSELKLLQETVYGVDKKQKIDISELAIDYGVFDESHTFKKVFTKSKGKPSEYTWKIDGLGKIHRNDEKFSIGKDNNKIAPLALSGWFVNRYIQMTNDGKNTIQLTATPFTNKPAEIFSMLALTNYKQLIDSGFQYMEDFFDLFMKIEFDLVLTTAQKILRKEVLVGFNNLAQMRRVIYSIMDYKSGEDANIKRPDKILYPSIVGERKTTIPATSLQETMFKDIKSYIKGKISYSEVCADNEQDVDVDEMPIDELISYVENYGTEAQKERFLEIEDFEEDDLQDLKNIVNKLLEKEEKESVDESELNDNEKAYVRVMRGIGMLKQVTLSPYLSTCYKESGIEPTFKQYIDSSPKLLYTLESIKSIHQYEKENNLPKSGIVIYMNIGVHPSYKGKKWSEGGFDKIKKYLVEEMGYSESEISIVSGKVDNVVKEKEKNKFLAGRSTVMIGSSTISTGVDLQNNSSALFMCSFDWNPTDNEQINGRIHRQGNRFAFVRIVYPMIMNSADPVIFQLLNEKSDRIKSIWDKEDKGTTLDLKDFDPKKFKKDLLDDPEDMVDFWIEEQITEIDDELIVLSRRLEDLRSANEDFSTLKKYTPVMKTMLTVIDGFKKELERDELKIKFNERKEEIENNSDLSDEEAFMQLRKLKKEFYDFTNDPDGRFVYEDFSNLSSEELLPKINYNILDAKSWYNKNITSNYEKKRELQRFYENNFPQQSSGVFEGEDLRVYLDWTSEWRINDVVNKWRGSVRKERKIREQLLLLNIEIDDIEVAKQQVNDRISELTEDRGKIRLKATEKFEEFSLLMEQRREVAPTISERVEEFAQKNDLLKIQLATFSEDKAIVVDAVDKKLDIKPTVEDVEVIEVVDVDKEQVSEIEYLEQKIKGFNDLLELEDDESEIEYLKGKIKAFEDLLLLEKM